MTIIFPAVTPSEHPTITSGRFPHVEKRSTGGRVRRIGLSNVQLNGEITLTFTNIDTEQLLKLRTHWMLARGTTLEFALPADLFPSMSPTTRARLMATTWKHKEKPKVVDICGGQPDFLLHLLEFTLVAQPRRVASPVDPTYPIQSLPVVPVTAPGAQLRVAVVFAPGAAGIDEIKLPGAAWVLSPVWLPGAAGMLGNINATGAAWAVSVEIGAGARTTPSAALNIITAWATGKASASGVAPGAALATSVMWLRGAASVSLLQAPGAALAAGVAWAPGGASITGGTAPGALLALGTAWQPGAAQGIAPGAAWSVSMVWVPGGMDPYFSSVSLLLPFDGNFTDSSSNGLIITNTSAGQISTTVKKWGSGSLRTLRAAYVSTLLLPSSSALDLTGDFTIEFNLYALQDRGMLMAFGSNQQGVLILNQNTTAETGANAYKIYLLNNAVELFDNVDVGLVKEQWRHIALTRSGSTLRLFGEGTLYATATDSGTYTVGAISGIANNVNFDGYFDDIRITKGVCRYTSNFTPPTGPHPTS
jgi:hypothetical protein